MVCLCHTFQQFKYFIFACAFYSQYIFYLLFTLIIAISIKLYFTEEIIPNLNETEEEKYFFLNSNKKEKKKFCKIVENKFSYDLSVVIPAYNEEDRIKICLDEIFENFEKTENSSKDKNLKYEIIVVNDGSVDKTDKIILKYTEKYGHDKIKLLNLSKNKGKGGAVRMGVLNTSGEYVLMCDADGATKFSDFNKLYKEIIGIKDTKYGKIVIGSRAHLKNESIIERTFFRTLLMKGFHLFVKYIGNVKNIDDTQCGFKLFSRKSAKFLFTNLHIERWAFDVELLYIAEKYKIPVSEIPVNWTEIDGSKLTPITAAIQMARDLMILRIYYIFGIYKVKEV